MSAFRSSWKSKSDNKSKAKSSWTSQANSQGKLSHSDEKKKTEVVVFMIVSDEEGAVSIPYQLWLEPIKSLVKQHAAVWCPVFKVWRTSRVQL